uniref:FAD dependent oxidoreductase domain-containing protein n=1 Tax=Panagrolaimus superbus TaxID=310955 RepID=A0A914XYJ3_9BILA
MKIAIIGQGVIGVSTALAILKQFPKAVITVFGDRPFDKTTSFGPAGLFRLDKYENKAWAKLTFDYLAEIEKNFPGSETGVKLLSGHIQSNEKYNLETQEKNYGDIVYNFRWLSDREIQQLFPGPSKYCIHYTAYASEGRLYVPWLRKQCEKIGNCEFVTRKIDSLQNLASEGFEIVINCAGLEAGKLAGDDNSVFPVRGVAFYVDAPWHKHFNYRDFGTFTIPMSDCVLVGSLKQPNRSDLDITDLDRDDIWKRYLQLHPSLKGAKVLAEWSGLRPDRASIRMEKSLKKDKNGKNFLLIHNYGHGGNGFTVGWGCALEVVEFIQEFLNLKSKI